MPAIDARPEDAPHSSQKQAWLKRLLLDFENFSVEHLDRPILKTPFWFLVLYATGVASLYDRLETRAFLTAGAANDHLVSWSQILPVILLAGIPTGFILYFAQGAGFHLLVKLSGGKASFGRSANILAYARLPLSLFLVSSIAFNAIYAGDDYWQGVSEDSIDYLLTFVTLTLLAFAIGNTFRAARRLHQTELVRSILFLIVAPSLLALVAFGVSALQGLQNPGDDLNQTGIQAYTRGDYTTAIQRYDEALKRTAPARREQRIQILHNKYLAQLHDGQTAAAKDTLSQAIALEEPGTSNYYLMRGSLAHFDNDTQQAIANYKRALEIDATSFQPHNELGIIYLGTYDMAYHDGEKALHHNAIAHQLSPDPVTLGLLARSHYQLEQYSEAESCYRRLLDQTPQDADATAYLALTYFESQQFEKSVAYFESCFALNPDYRSDYLLECYQEALDRTAALKLQ